MSCYHACLSCLFPEALHSSNIAVGRTPHRLMNALLRWTHRGYFQCSHCLAYYGLRPMVAHPCKLFLPLRTTERCSKDWSPSRFDLTCHCHSLIFSLGTWSGSTSYTDALLRTSVLIDVTLKSSFSRSVTHNYFAVNILLIVNRFASWRIH